MRRIGAIALLILAWCALRTFGATFAAQRALKATPAPFMTVVYHFAEGDLWLSERGRPTTIDGETMNPIVISFGQIGAALSRAPEIVDVGDTTISFINFPVLQGTGYAGRSFSDTFGNDIESVAVDFYANFLLPDNSVVSEIFASGVSRFNFRDQSAFYDEEIGAIVVTALTEKWWQRNVLKQATLAEYANIGTDAVGKNFALPFGTAPKIPGLRLDATADRFTIAESDEFNPVVSIGQLYWNTRPFVETDVAFAIPEDASFYNLDLQNGIASPGEILGSGGDQYFRGGASSLSTFLDVADGDPGETNTMFFWQPFSPKVDVILTGLTPVIDAGPLGSEPIDLTEVYLAICDSERNVIQERYQVVKGAGRVPITQFYMPLKGGRKYFVRIGVVSAGSTLRIAAGGSSPTGGAWDATYENTDGEFPLTDYPGNTIYTGINITYFAIPVGIAANLASDADPLGVSSALGQKLVDELESPGIVLVGMRVAVRAPVTPDDRLEGDLRVEVFSLANGQQTSIASTTITSQEFMDALEEEHYGTYVPFYQTLEEPVFLPAGRVGVGVTNEISRAQVEAEAAAVAADEPAPLFLRWRWQGFDTTEVASSGARLWPGTLAGSPSSPTPALGPDNVTVKLNIVLYALKFDRFPDSPVQTVEGTDGSFNVASVVPGLVPYRISETRRVPIPQGTAIAGDVVCTYSRCDEVIHALANRAGIPDARIDLAGSFTAAAAKYAANGYRNDGAVSSQQTYKQLFARLGFEGRSVVDWQWDKMQLKWTPSIGEVTASVKTFDRTNILPKEENGVVSSLKVKRTTETEIVNVIRARWNRDLIENDYDAAKRYESAASIAVHGELSRDDLFDFLYVRTDAMVDHVCANKLERMAFSKRIFQWEAFLESLGIEREDAIDFAMAVYGGAGGSGGVGEGEVGEGGWGGGSGVFAGLSPGTFSLVERVDYNWSNFKTILLESREL